MRERLTMVFSKELRLSAAAGGEPERTEDLSSLCEELFGAFVEGDKKRFESFCSVPPDGMRINQCVSVFRLCDFLGYGYVFAEKRWESVEPSDKSADEIEAHLADMDRNVYLTFFEGADEMNEYTARVYERFFSAYDRLDEEDIPVFSPECKVFRKMAPGLVEFHEDISDPYLVTEQVIHGFLQNPFFYGNRITFQRSEEGADRDNRTYIFNERTFVHVLMNLLAGIVESTVTHEVHVLARSLPSGVEIEIKTKSEPYAAEDMTFVSDLTNISFFAEYMQPVICLTESAAEVCRLRPSLSYDSEDGSLSVFVRCESFLPSEGEFRYRDKTDSVHTAIEEAECIYQFVTDTFAERRNERRNKQGNGQYFFPSETVF